MATSVVAPFASDASAMLGMVPQDAFDDMPTDAPETVETPAEEAPETSDQPTEEVAPEETPAEEPEQPVEEPVPGEELPEGVFREAKGYRVDESRWKTVYGNHQLVQQAAELLGEPVTREALELRQQAYQMQEQLYSDLNSADPGLQGRVLDFVLGDMSRAQREGEVGADPTVSFTQAFYDKIQQHPDAYAQLRFLAAKDLATEFFQQAAQSGDKSLFAGAQHLVRTLAGIGPELSNNSNGIATLRATAERMGLPFYLENEMAGLARGADPVAQLRQENERLQAQLKGGQTSTQAAQFESWKSSTKQAVASGVAEGALKPALESVAANWKDFPKEYQEQVVGPLQKQVNDILNRDSAFNTQIQMLDQAAQRAVSQQVRDRIAQQIKQAYVNRAQSAIEAAKRPILTQAAEWLKGRSAANHARRQAGQSQTAPKGVTTAVPRSVTDGVDKSVFTDASGVFDPMKAAQYLNRTLPR